MKAGDYWVKWFHNVKEGATVCTLDKDENVAGTGLAELSVNDQYDRSIGRKVSLTRALTNADISRKERTEIWHTLMAKGVKFRS